MNEISVSCYMWGTQDWVIVVVAWQFTSSKVVGTILFLFLFFWFEAEIDTWKLALIYEQGWRTGPLGASYAPFLGGYHDFG